MRRRVFIAGAFALFAPTAARAQTLPRLTMLLTGSPAAPSLEHDAFMRQLAALGWTEGQQLVVDRRWTEEPAQLAHLAVEAVRAKPTVILAAGPEATRGARQATSTIPIVMIAATDPRLFGAASFARPGGNMTGVTVGPPELVNEKRLQLFKEALPTVSRVVVMWDVKLSSDVPGMGGMANAARALGLHVQHVDVRGVRDFDAAFAAAKKDNADGVLMVESPRTVAQRALVAELGLKYRLPIMSHFSRIVEAGGLMSYGPSLSDLFERAAVYVDKILRGTKPADLPIEQPSKFELVINLKTAKALGLTIPAAVRLRADRIIE
jgi:ABC-type uncharacterized transport system substrate-binding protein